MNQRGDKTKLPFDPTCDAILQNVRWKQMPKLPADLKHSTNPLDLNKLGTIAPDLDELRRSEMTPGRIRKLFENFEFVNENGLHDKDSPLLITNVIREKIC